MLSDIEIAQRAKMKDINEIAEMIGLDSGGIEPYGHYKAKISNETLEALKDKDDGKLVLVTAVNPTPAGEGKTTVSIGLSQAINKLGKKAVAALREPSLGPVFGIKGGAAGGGYSQVVPMEDINLHFTGDMHAITSANNLMCAILDNHIQQGNGNLSRASSALVASSSALVLMTSPSNLGAGAASSGLASVNFDVMTLYRASIISLTLASSSVL